MNALAAIATAAIYNVDMPTVKPVLENIKVIPGRMEFVQYEPFRIVVDYAHTPNSLQIVYEILKKDSSGQLICVLGAAGGGRDRWKRLEFGKIAQQYCDHIFLTNEDPYDENPRIIIDEVAAGIAPNAQMKVQVILNRKEAIEKALASSNSGDTVVITGKGSETSIAISGGRKLPWSDKKTVEELLER